MVTKELIDFIQKSRLFGRTDEQIKAMLLNNGWKAEDIETGFGSAEFNPAPSEELVTPNKKTSKIWVWVFGGFLALVLFAVGGFFVYQNYINPKADLPKGKDAAGTEMSEDQKKPQNSEITFAENLGSCTKDKITFTHPFTGETLEKEILGIADGKCKYVEQMPNNGKMECNYSESERIAAAKYYKDVAFALSGEMEAGMDSSSGEIRTTYKINGKEVENPVQEAMDNGICVISGY